MLPGGQTVLFTSSAAYGAYEEANIDVLSMKSGHVKTVQRGGYFGRYVPSGHLIYVHEGTLFGVSFDPARLETRGMPVPLLEDVAGNATTGAGQLDLSQTGTLVYLSGKSFGGSGWRIALMDGAGQTEPLLTTPTAAYTPRFSPDGRRLA